MQRRQTLLDSKELSNMNRVVPDENMKFFMKWKRLHESINEAYDQIHERIGGFFKLLEFINQRKRS